MNADRLQYRIVEGILARSTGESLVLFQPETGRFLTLNACGARVWELLTECPSVGQLVARLTEEFSGPQGLIQQQVREFLIDLEKEKLIWVENEQAPASQGPDDAA